MNVSDTFYTRSTPFVNANFMMSKSTAFANPFFSQSTHQIYAQQPLPKSDESLISTSFLDQNMSMDIEYDKEIFYHQKPEPKLKLADRVSQMSSAFWFWPKNKCT